ncbi:hypothetical protein V6N13_085803 [Hibiscus sabdariffa]|uniref:Uncharacterized protein n=1 Tax=Hibiscus sabdariffa TaxID=183260 RepID=A0ABR2FR96_9ROSI
MTRERTGQTKIGPNSLWRIYQNSDIIVEPISSINLLRLQLRSQRIDLSESEEDTEYRLDRSFLIKSSV